jgi:tetratricopeptide (TPR) repeat protein
MPFAPKDDENRELSPVNKRLDGWKDIAAYLGRSERTVKRWEAEGGLPTHRVPGARKRSVFAFTAELDEWLRSSAGREPDQQPDLYESEVKEAFASSAAVRTDAKIDDLVPTEAQESQAEPAVAVVAPAFDADRAWRTPAVYATALSVLIVASVGFGFLKPGRDVHATGSARPIEKQQSPQTSVSQTTVSPDKAAAHDYYLNGRYEWNQRTPESLNRALDSFTQAIVHDPGNADAFVGLSETYSLLREFSTMPNDEAFTRSLAAARKAVALDDSLAEAHRALAFAEMYGSFDFVNAEREFRRAIELDPKDPVVRRWYANAFAVPGNFDVCLQQMNIAQALDPGSNATLADKGWMLFLAGKRDDGVRTLRQVERSAPEFRSPHTYLMQIGFEMRNYPLFLDEGEKMADSANDSDLRQVIAASRRAYQHSGEAGLLQVWYDESKKPRIDAGFIGQIEAKACARLGKNREAIQILQEQYLRRDCNVLACISHPSLLALKSDPGYRDLVAKIEFPVYTKAGPTGLLASSADQISRPISTPR